MHINPPVLSRQKKAGGSVGAEQNHQEESNNKKKKRGQNTLKWYNTFTILKKTKKQTNTGLKAVRLLNLNLHAHKHTQTYTPIQFSYPFLVFDIKLLFMLLPGPDWLISLITASHLL